MQPYSPQKHSYDLNSGKSSPIGSPLKQPRDAVHAGNADYSPMKRGDVLGKPIEIIEGK